MIPSLGACNPRSKCEREAADQCFHLTSVFPSLLLSHFLSLEAMKKCPSVKVNNKQTNKQTNYPSSSQNETSFYKP